MDESQQQAVRDYLTRDTKYHRGAGPLATVAMMVAIFFVELFTQPWPTRGAGGGYGSNQWGPLLAFAAGFVAFVLVFRLMRRRSPLRAPRL